MKGPVLCAYAQTLKDNSQRSFVAWMMMHEVCWRSWSSRASRALWTPVALSFCLGDQVNIDIEPLQPMWYSWKQRPLLNVPAVCERISNRQRTCNFSGGCHVSDCLMFTVLLLNWGSLLFPRWQLFYGQHEEIPNLARCVSRSWAAQSCSGIY